jgi:hypothetical protein
MKNKPNNVKIINISTSTIQIDGRRSVTIYGLGDDELVYEYKLESGSWELYG